MCEKCDAMQARCDDIASWMQTKDLHKPVDEDMDLLSFLTAKIIAKTGGLPIMTGDMLMELNALAYFVGYKKGFEVKALEVL